MDKKYALKNNTILKDECVLFAWNYQLKRFSRDFSNPYSHSLPIMMFKREEDKEKLNLIERKTNEIISLYKELYSDFIKSLTKEEIQKIL